jgi:hypothetical protein
LAVISQAPSIDVKEPKTEGAAMEFASIFAADDAERARRTLQKLRQHGIEPLVLTGGIAIELHLRSRGISAEMRPLNDIDFLVDRFNEIPRTLAGDFLFRHVHPHDPPAKTLLQSVDPETEVRVDVFRACGETKARAQAVEICGTPIRMISLEDITARTARLCMDLAAGAPMPAKHARDFLRLLTLVEPSRVERAWQDQRKPDHPESFAEAAELLRWLIATRRDLQIVPVYSQDARAVCPRCEGSEAFPLADGERILSLLGYC